MSNRLPSRPVTPSDRTGFVSRTGMDVEAQILDGGGVKGIETGEDGVVSPIRQPSPLRPR